jgi:fission process protein 1
MWWGKSKDPKPEEKSEVVKSEVAQIKDTVAEKLPTKERISHGIQDAVNQTGKNGNVFDDITEG